MPFTDSEVAKFSLQPGDVLMCEGGEPGRCSVWKMQNSNIKFQKAIHRIRSRGDVEPAYIVAYFESIIGTMQFQTCLTGATIKHLPRERLVDICIPLPSLAEQREIVKRLDLLAEKIKMLEQNYAQQIADCVEMRQAVLREAFEGRL
jgi:type I restriction enzyme S subunit